jgi:hypothetical protein
VEFASVTHDRVTGLTVLLLAWRDRQHRLSFTWRDGMGVAARARRRRAAAEVGVRVNGPNWVRPDNVHRPQRASRSGRHVFLYLRVPVPTGLVTAGTYRLAGLRVGRDLGAVGNRSGRRVRAPPDMSGRPPRSTRPPADQPLSTRGAGALTPSGRSTEGADRGSWRDAQTSSASASRAGGPASANQAATTWSSVGDHVPDTTPPTITMFACRLTSVRLAGGTTWASAVPGPRTHWSCPGRSRRAVVAGVAARSSRFSRRT